MVRPPPELPDLIVEIYMIGSSVDVNVPGGTSINGVITALMIKGGEPGVHVEYEVVWWAGGTRNQEWITELEIKPSSLDLKLQIGFSNKQKDLS